MGCGVGDSPRIIYVAFIISIVPKVSGINRLDCIIMGISMYNYTLKALYKDKEVIIHIVI